MASFREKLFGHPYPRLQEDRAVMATTAKAVFLTIFFMASCFPIDIIFHGMERKSKGCYYSNSRKIKNLLAYDQ